MAIVLREEYRELPQEIKDALEIKVGEFETFMDSIMYGSDEILNPLLNRGEEYQETIPQIRKLLSKGFFKSALGVLEMLDDFPREKKGYFIKLADEKQKKYDLMVLEIQNLRNQVVYNF